MLASIALSACFINSIFSSPINTPANGVQYQVGSPVLSQDVNVYITYYGNWTLEQKTIIESFTQNIGGSDWYKINQKYYSQADSNAEKVYVRGQIRLAKTSQDPGSRGWFIKGNEIQEIIQEQLDSGAFVEDSNGVYFVLLGGNVQENIRWDQGKGRLCGDYCSYHLSWPMKSGFRLPYSMVSLPTECLNYCIPHENLEHSPNQDVALDGMLSNFAQELVSTIINPFPENQKGWSDGNYEPAELCTYSFGPVRSVGDAYYNLELDGRKYLIQNNFNLDTQSCASSA